MHQTLENLPVTWAGIDTVYHVLPAGTDFTPLLKGLPDDMCPCPHWGYVFKGALYTRYTDGTVEVAREGEVFYLPPGHTGWNDEDTIVLMFSPEKEHLPVLEHARKKQEELSQQKG